MPSCTLPQRASIASLPLELRVKILEMAIDDGRWEDMTTLEAVMLVNKACFAVAAPVFWRVLDLAAKGTAKLDRFFQLPLGVRQLVRYIRTGQGLADEPSSDERIHKLCDVVSEAPNLVGLDVALVGPYEHGAPGWALFERLRYNVWPKLQVFELFFPSRLKACPISLPNRALLSYLNPDHLQRLTLYGVANLSPDDLERTLHSVQDFPLVRLTPFPAPLRSFHLDFYNSTMSAEDISDFLSSVAVTLEYLSISVSVEGDLPAIHLPRLRSLLLSTNEPIEHLASLCTAPLELVEIVPPDFEPPTRASLMKSLKAMRNTLEVLISNEDIADHIQPKEVKPFVNWVHRRGVWYLDRTWEGFQPAWWDVSEALDDFSTPRRLGGEGLARKDDLAWRVSSVDGIEAEEDENWED
ncbi:hypothetical protein JCM10213v2_007199 [Rhodosporidiobolus nylandii]